MAGKKNTIIKAGDKEYSYYRITKTIGHEIRDGRSVPIKKQFTGSSKREAEEKYIKWKTERSSESVKYNYKIFSEALDYYVTNILSVNSKYSIGTRELYESSYNKHLKGNIITRKLLSDVTTNDIQTYYNKLDITQSALETLNKFLKGFYVWADNNGYCENIMHKIVLPEKRIVTKQDDIVVWTDEEIANIMSVEPDYELLPLITFALYTGMRISELFGLKWEDIKDDKIVIRRQYYRGSWTTPKNDKIREIPMHKKIKEIVNTARGEGLVFATKNRTPYDYKNIIRSLDRFYKRNGIEHKKFHAYRATFCTNLCKNGVPIQVASKLMGHESILVTAKYYTSIEFDTMSNAINQI